MSPSPPEQALDVQPHSPPENRFGSERATQPRWQIGLALNLGSGRVVCRSGEAVLHCASTVLSSRATSSARATYRSCARRWLLLGQPTAGEGCLSANLKPGHDGGSWIRPSTARLAVQATPLDAPAGRCSKFACTRSRKPGTPELATSYIKPSPDGTRSRRRSRPNQPERLAPRDAKRRGGGRRAAPKHVWPRVRRQYRGRGEATSTGIG